jgi:hypothetical protein
MWSSSCFPQVHPLILPRRWIFHFFSALKPLLTPKTVLSPRQGFQSPLANVVPATGTHAEGAMLYSRQRCLKHAQQAAALTTTLKQRFLGESRDATIRDILWVVGIHSACLISQSIQHSQCLFTMDFEAAPEALNFEVVHLFSPPEVSVS